MDTDDVLTSESPSSPQPAANNPAANESFHLEDSSIDGAVNDAISTVLDVVEVQCSDDQKAPHEGEDTNHISDNNLGTSDAIPASVDIQSTASNTIINDSSTGSTAPGSAAADGVCVTYVPTSSRPEPAEPGTLQGAASALHSADAQPLQLDMSTASADAYESDTFASADDLSNGILSTDDNGQSSTANLGQADHTIAAPSDQKPAEAIDGNSVYESVEKSGDLTTDADGLSMDADTAHPGAEPSAVDAAPTEAEPEEYESDEYESDQFEGPTASVIAEKLAETVPLEGSAGLSPEETRTGITGQTSEESDAPGQYDEEFENYDEDDDDDFGMDDAAFQETLEAVQNMDLGSAEERLQVKLEEQQLRALTAASAQAAIDRQIQERELAGMRSEEELQTKHRDRFFGVDFEREELQREAAARAAMAREDMISGMWMRQAQVLEAEEEEIRRQEEEQRQAHELTLQESERRKMALEEQQQRTLDRFWGCDIAADEERTRAIREAAQRREAQANAVQKRMAARDMKWFAANSKKQEQERQHQLQMDREARRRYMARFYSATTSTEIMNYMWPVDDDLTMKLSEVGVQQEFHLGAVYSPHRRTDPVKTVHSLNAVRTAGKKYRQLMEQPSGFRLAPDLRPGGSESTVQPVSFTSSLNMDEDRRKVRAMRKLGSSRNLNASIGSRFSQSLRSNAPRSIDTLLGLSNSLRITVQHNPLVRSALEHVIEHGSMLNMPIPAGSHRSTREVSLRGWINTESGAEYYAALWKRSIMYLFVDSAACAAFFCDKAGADVIIGWIDLEQVVHVTWEAVADGPSWIRLLAPDFTWQFVLDISKLKQQKTTELNLLEQEATKREGEHTRLASVAEARVGAAGTDTADATLLRRREARAQAATMAADLARAEWQAAKEAVDNAKHAMETLGIDEVSHWFAVIRSGVVTRMRHLSRVCDDSALTSLGQGQAVDTSELTQEVVDTIYAFHLSKLGPWAAPVSKIQTIDAMHRSLPSFETGNNDSPRSQWLERGTVSIINDKFGFIRPSDATKEHDIFFYGTDARQQLQSGDPVMFATVKDERGSSESHLRAIRIARIPPLPFVLYGQMEAAEALHSNAADTLLTATDDSNTLDRPSRSTRSSNLGTERESTHSDVHHHALGVSQKLLKELSKEFKADDDRIERLRRPVPKPQKPRATAALRRSQQMQVPPPQPPRQVQGEHRGSMAGMSERSVGSKANSTSAGSRRTRRRRSTSTKPNAAELSRTEVATLKSLLKHPINAEDPTVYTELMSIPAPLQKPKPPSERKVEVSASIDFAVDVNAPRSVQTESSNATIRAETDRLLARLEGFGSPLTNST